MAETKSRKTVPKQKEDKSKVKKVNPTRESKYSERVEPYLDYVEKLARSGANQVQIAEALKIGKRTLTNYINQFPALRKAINSGREVAIVELENALYKSAIGFKERVTKSVKVKRVIYENGKKKGEVETMVPVEEETYIPPQVGAAIFLLKNWAKDKHYSNDPETVGLRYREVAVKEKLAEAEGLDISEEEKVVIINDLSQELREIEAQEAKLKETVPGFEKKLNPKEHGVDDEN